MHPKSLVLGVAWQVGSALLLALCVVYAARVVIGFRDPAAPNARAFWAGLVGGFAFTSAPFYALLYLFTPGAGLLADISNLIRWQLIGPVQMGEHTHWIPGFVQGFALVAYLSKLSDRRRTSGSSA